MAEITRQRQGELVRGVFSILKEHPEGLPAAETLRRLEELVPPTPFEDSTYPKSPNVRRYGKIVRFSTIGPVKAGWLVKERGQWSLTEDGLKAFETLTDPEAFMAEASRLYRVWKKSQPVEEEAADEEVEGDSSTGFEEAEEAAWGEIRTYLAKMPPYEFQDLVAGLLRAMGYHVDWVSPPGADRGMDIVAYNDALGTSHPRIKVQVKRRPDSKMGAEDIRSFLAVLGDQDVGIFVCTGGFSSEAQREARSQEKRRLTLIDGDRLVELWIEYFARLEDADRLRLPLRPVYFLSPEN